jgi:hypothetical protein
VLNTVTRTVTTTVNRLDPTRWQGYSHDELYQLLHDGPGATASALPIQRWTEIASTLADVDADLRGALTRSADGWRGSAASVAYERLSTLANWADSASENAGAMRDATQRQADNIAKARADMPAPTKVPPASPDPTAAPVMQLLTLQGDQETPDAAASAGEQTAHDVMTTYQLNTESTVQALGNFVAPERVAVPQGDPHSHGHGHGVQGITTPSGLIDGLLGNTGHHNGHADGSHHGGYNGGSPGGANGASTSSSGSHWYGGDHNTAPGRYSPPAEPSGNRSFGYGPAMPSFGQDEDENRRSTSSGGRTSMPGSNGPVSGVEYGTGSPGSLGGGANGTLNGTVSGGGNGPINGGGNFSGVLGGPNSALPNSAAPGAHGLTTGANPAANVLNPNEMPPPAAAPNNTMTAGTTGGAGATGATAAHSGADKLLGRRGFDPGPASNGSWLAEPEPAVQSSSVRGSAPRRRDFKAQVRVTEKVQVDGEEVELPERVIGGSEDDRDR